MTDNMRLGIRLGLYLAPLGILLALPTFIATVRIHSMADGPAYWLYWVQNLLPLALLALVGGLARRRGYGSASTGLWAGITYGLVAGASLYGAAALTPDRSRLANEVWRALLLRGYVGTPARHHAVVASVMHPNAPAYIANTALEFALVGLLAALGGGLLLRGPKQQPEAAHE
jgi:hypothetical protein